MGRYLLCLVFLTAPARAAPPPTVICQDAATGDKATVRVPQLKRQVEALPRVLRKRRLHILDLNEEAQERRRRLPADVAAESWCAVRAHVNAIEDALALVRLNQGFVSAKFGHVERWVRAGRHDPARQQEIERLVANAAAHMADKRHERANQLLNRVMAVLFGSADPWSIPESLPEAEEAGGTGSGAATLDPTEVASGCPGLAKQGRAGPGDLEGVLQRLAKAMDRRRVRPLDLKGGDQLFADLASYRRLSAVWPATRVACALVARTRELEIDLGTVMKRLQHANRLRNERQLSATEEERYTELVRAATALLAERKFDEATAAADDMLVLVGEPQPPSAVLR